MYKPRRDVAFKQKCPGIREIHFLRIKRKNKYLDWDYFTPGTPIRYPCTERYTDRTGDRICWRPIRYFTFLISSFQGNTKQNLIILYFLIGYTLGYMICNFGPFHGKTKKLYQDVFKCDFSRANIQNVTTVCCQISVPTSSLGCPLYIVFLIKLNIVSLLCFPQKLEHDLIFPYT